MGDMRNSHKMVEKLEGKSPLGRTRHRWEDNIRLNLREIGYSVGNYSLDPSGSG
jgi:hypothetical protein